MDLPPAVIIHGLADARLALARGRPVTLLSAPGAALYAGCGWWSALLAAAQSPYPCLLDCDGAPGRAVEALRIGLKGIVLDAEPALFARLAVLAAAARALLLAAPPPALDLAGGAQPLDAWLERAR